MDLVTVVAACVLGLRSDLFVPIGQRAQCTQAAVEAAPLINGTRRRSIDQWDAQIAAASRQFAVPVRLIRAVLRAESDGIATATSSAGAMGLMQLMPGTWADMRVRYRLGDDPYSPADNILAGVAFLRELIDRYGAPDFLAAYNAGPGRVDALRQFWSCASGRDETLCCAARPSSQTRSFKDQFGRFVAAHRARSRSLAGSVSCDRTAKCTPSAAFVRATG